MLSDVDIDWLAMRLCAADGGPSKNMELSWGNSTERWRERYRHLVRTVLADADGLAAGVRVQDGRLEGDVLRVLRDRGERGASAAMIADRLQAPVADVTARLDMLRARGVTRYHGQRWSAAP